MVPQGGMVSHPLSALNLPEVTWSGCPGKWQTRCVVRSEFQAGPVHFHMTQGPRAGGVASKGPRHTGQPSGTPDWGLAPLRDLLTSSWPRRVLKQGLPAGKPQNSLVCAGSSECGCRSLARMHAQS